MDPSLTAPRLEVIDLPFNRFNIDRTRGMTLVGFLLSDCNGGILVPDHLFHLFSVRIPDGTAFKNWDFIW